MLRISQLRPIDIHFGNVLQSAYRDVDGAGHSDGFRSFLSRPEKERIYRGRYDDPRSFLAALRKYQEQQVTASIQANGGALEDVLQSFNQAKLPSVWYYRNLSYRIADASYQATIRGLQVEIDGKPLLLDGLYLDVTYRIIFVAYDTESLDALVTAFMLYVNSPLRGAGGEVASLPVCNMQGNRGFDVPYNIGSMPASFGDTRSVSAEVIPGAHEDGRIYAAEISEFPVTVPLLRSADFALNVVVPDSINVCLSSKALPYG